MIEVATTVIVIKYKTVDDVIFDRKEDAILHEDLKAGRARTCPNCHGKKR